MNLLFRVLGYNPVMFQRGRWKSTLLPWFSKCGTGTASISTIWELLSYAKSQPYPRSTESEPGGGTEEFVATSPAQDSDVG